MPGADAEQATKQRDKSKVELGTTRLICVRQKETLILRNASVFVNSKLCLGNSGTLVLRLFSVGEDLASPGLVQGPDGAVVSRTHCRSEHKAEE